MQRLQELYNAIQNDFQTYGSRLPEAERQRITNEIKRLEEMAKTMQIDLANQQENDPKLNVFTEIAKITHELTAYRTQANFVLSQLLPPDSDGIYLLKKAQIDLFKNCFVLWQKAADLVQKITDINATSGQNWFEYFTDDHVIAIVKNFKIDEQTTTTFAKELRLYAADVFRWQPVYKAILLGRYIVDKEKILDTPDDFENECATLIEKMFTRIKFILDEYKNTGYILQADYVELLDFQAKFAILENSLVTLLLQKKDYSQTQAYQILKSINDYIYSFLQTHIVETAIEFEDRIESTEKIPIDPPAKWEILTKRTSKNGFSTYQIRNSNGVFWILENLVDNGDNIVTEYFFSNSLGKWQKFNASEPKPMIEDLKILGHRILETGGIIFVGTMMVFAELLIAKRLAVSQSFLKKVLVHSAIQQVFLDIQSFEKPELWGDWGNIDIGDAVVQSINWGGIRATWFNKIGGQFIMEVVVPSSFDINLNGYSYSIIPAQFEISILSHQQKNGLHIASDVLFNTLGYGINRGFDWMKDSKGGGKLLNDKTGNLEIDEVPYYMLHTSNVVIEGAVGSNGLGSIMKNLFLIPEEDKNIPNTNPENENDIPSKN